jgi:hypothetical protein
MKRYRCGTVPDLNRTSSKKDMIVFIVYLIVLENNINHVICQTLPDVGALTVQFQLIFV